jgi:protein-tyrosine phosphatase
MSNEHAQILSLYYKVDAEKIFVLNISDPYGGDIDIYRSCRDEIYNSIKEIISQVK